MKKISIIIVIIGFYISVVNLSCCVIYEHYSHIMWDNSKQWEDRESAEKSAEKVIQIESYLVPFLLFQK